MDLGDRFDNFTYCCDWSALLYAHEAPVKLKSHDVMSARYGNGAVGLENVYFD